MSQAFVLLFSTVASHTCTALLNSALLYGKTTLKSFKMQGGHAVLQTSQD